MVTIDATLLFIFAFFLIATYVGGGLFAWILSAEARHDRAELRQERQRLTEENHTLSNEILTLKEEIIDLRGQLAAALQEINKLTTVLDREANPLS